MIRDDDERPPHVLRQTKRTTMPARVVFVDTETFQEKMPAGVIKQVFRLGVACLWTRKQENTGKEPRWFQFTDKGLFWDWLISHTTKRTTTYLVAHNVKFDLLVLDLVHEMPARHWKLWQLYEKGMVFLLNICLPTPEFADWLEYEPDPSAFEGKRWEKTITVVDNGNLFPGTLKALGTALHYPKMHVPDEAKTDDDWFTYCKRDVDVMVKAWESRRSFLQVNQLGSFKFTLASQSFESFRFRFLHHNIHIHSDPHALPLERAAYHGGRTEAFYVGKPPATPVYKLDVNSMYPAVMRDERCPLELIAYKVDPSLQTLAIRLTHQLVIAEVEIRTSLPVFPVERADRNVYPIGHLTLVLTTPELKLALARGWIRNVYQMVCYSHANLFREFVDFLYPIKVAAKVANDGMGYLFAKLMLNAQYGKWGQKGYEDRIIGTCDPYQMEVIHGSNIETRKSVVLTYLSGLVTETREKGEAYNSFPALAAHITAYARIYLWSLIEQAGHENVYYCDTDSLFVSPSGYNNLKHLIHPTRLGSLKVEGVSDDVLLYGPKDYTWDGKATLKGIPRQAIKVGENTYELTYWDSFREHLATGRTDTFYTHTGKRKLSRSIAWGDLTESGWIHPFNYG